MNAKLITFLCIVTLLVGCKPRNSVEGGDQMRAMKSESAMLERADVESMPAPPPPPPASAEANVNIDKKIIKTAYLSIEVTSYELSRKQIDAIIKDYSAYILNENLQNTDYQITNNINIKVPAEKFEKLLEEIAKLAKKTDYQNIEMKDVTEEFIDVETRLSNSRKVEQTYLKLLRKTNSIEDILKIEQKLGEIRTEIESTQGRLKYLNNQVSYSSINLNIYQKLEFKYIPEKSESFFQRLLKALDTGWKGIGTFLLFLIKLWPLWIFAAAGWYGWKYFVNLRRTRKKELKRKLKQEKRDRKEAKQQEENPQD